MEPATCDVARVLAPPPTGRAVRRTFGEVPDDATPYAVRMRDGIRLATDVYLPARSGRWPVLLSRLPYDKTADECFMPAIARWFNDRGFAVVVQDVRGKIRSDGELAPFRAEVADGYDTIEWVTEQPWSAGPVGMFGDSYFGWTQWAAAESRHPALRAIAPRVISTDFADLLVRQGVPSLEIAALWALETWVDEALYGYEGALDWSVRPLSEVVSSALGDRRSAFLDDLVRRGPDPAGRVPVRGDLPTLHAGGWWDVIKRGQLTTWREARRQDMAPQFLVMDAVDHGWTPLREPGEPFVDPLADSATTARFLDGYLGPLYAFMEHFLGEGSGSYDVAPVRWKLGRGSWRESATWPPPESSSVTWYAAPGGALAATADRQRTTVRWVHDPSDPVPSNAHAYHPLVEPADESGAVDRDDVLVFDTAPLREPVDLAGPAEVSLELSSSGPSTHVMARLVEVRPDGTAFKVLDGAAAVHGTWPRQVTVDLGDTGYRVRAGHRLRLEVSSSEFPRYLPHPGTDADPWTATDYVPTEQSVALGGDRALRLCLTVLPVTGEGS